MIINMSGGRSGDTLTVTTPGAGITVTVSKDGKSKTKISGADGVAVFRGLESGEWSVACTDGAQTSVPQTVTVKNDYEAELTFFASTIHVTYPAGSTCTATDDVTTLTAPDTSGTWECTVPNAGTWTVACTSGGKSDSENVQITNDGQTVSVELSYDLPIFVNGMHGTYGTYDSSFIDITSDYITLRNGDSLPGIVWLDPIDLSAYNTLTFEYWCTFAGGKYAAIGVSGNKNYSGYIHFQEGNYSACKKITATTSGWVKASIALPTSGTHYPRISSWQDTIKFRNIMLTKG